MATRILSWEQLVREADPEFARLSLRPWVYEFSDGTRFRDHVPLYGEYPHVTDADLLLFEDGSGIELENESGLLMTEQTMSVPN